MVKRRDMTNRMAGVGYPAEATPHVSLFPDVKLSVKTTPHGDSLPHEVSANAHFSHCLRAFVCVLSI
jgi:hypothetical protein